MRVLMRYNDRQFIDLLFFVGEVVKTSSNQFTLITHIPVHITQNPEIFSEYEFEI